MGLIACINNDLIPYLDLLQMAKDLAIDIIVPRNETVSAFSRIGGPDVMSSTLFELLPIVSRDDRHIDVDARNNQPRR